MVMGIFFGGLLLALTAMSHMAIQVWRHREAARQEIPVSRRALNRKDQSGA